jgi:hypothetical protein
MKIILKQMIECGLDEIIIIDEMIHLHIDFLEN